MSIPLEIPESFGVEAAQGWLGLGLPEEADAELASIPAHLVQHPQVLNVRFEICAARADWKQALDFAARMIQVAPGHGLGWVNQSFALHELKRTAEARDHLLSVVDKFPASPTIRYNLGCYECQLGRLDEAKKWLTEAFLLGEGWRMRGSATEDPDLKPLREWLSETNSLLP